MRWISCDYQSVDTVCFTCFESIFVMLGLYSLAQDRPFLQEVVVKFFLLWMLVVRWQRLSKQNIFLVLIQFATKVAVLHPRKFQWM